LLLSVVAAIIVARRLGRPVQRLADVARQVGALDLAGIRRLPRGHIREINQAADAFERMATGLRWFETYVPRALVRRLIAAGEAKPASEEREVTIMFTDLQGFTAFSQTSSPADSADYLNQLLARIGPLIERSGGTIDKYTGDGVMAFWGAPAERADHARAACDAAVALAATVAAFNGERRAAGSRACAMRIGIHTGRVLVGNIGFAGKVDYTIIGSAANCAQRIEQAGKGCIGDADSVVLVSDATRIAAAGHFVFTDVADGCLVAGEVVRVWRLVARRPGGVTDAMTGGRPAKRRRN
jgi:adenylate cyclase